MDRAQLLIRLMEHVQSTGHPYWKGRLAALPPGRIHAAILVEPYCSRILSGEKTMESRFSVKRVSPWHRIVPGDAVFLKRSGGEFVGIFEAGEVRFRQLRSASDWLEIQGAFGEQLCVEDDFWERKRDSRYATLIAISRLLILEPFSIRFANRQSWIDFGAPPGEP